MNHKKLELGSRPITVYDVRWKKPVLIFRSGSKCYRYLKDRYNGDITSYVKNKGKMHENRFFRTLCFRFSNTAQQTLTRRTGLCGFGSLVCIPGC
jgi:hypothetical protein